MKKKYEMDMCSGSVFQKMLLFAIPLMCSSILQLLFNAARSEEHTSELQSPLEIAVGVVGE